MFYTFIVAFMVISFFTLMYAHGYRFNWVWPPKPSLIFQKTGMLLVKTRPKEATILLNGKNPRAIRKQIPPRGELDPVQSPAKIRRISPGSYNLKLRKEGYHDWQREVEVYPGQITSLIDIRLIKDEIPLKIFEVEINKDTLSPSRRYALNRDGDKIIDISKENTILLPGDIATSSPKWSPDEKKILLGTKIFSLSQEKTISELPIPKENIEAEWGKNSKHIYYRPDKTLMEMKVETRDTRKIITSEGTTTDLLVKNDLIYIMIGRENNSELHVYSPKQKKTIKKIDFPLSSAYHMADTPDRGKLTVYDKNYNTLYIISPLNPISPLRETVNNVKFFQWNNKKEIIYGNNFEIWKLDVDHHNRTLLTRRSEKINGVIPHPETRKIIYYTDNKINIIEETGPNKIEKTELTELPTISDVFLGRQKQELYFNSRIGHHQGFYKLAIY